MFQMSQFQRPSSGLSIHRYPRSSTLTGALSLLVTGCGAIGMDLGRDIAATYADPGDTTDEPDAMATGGLLCPDADGELVVCVPNETPRPNGFCLAADSVEHCVVALPGDAELEPIDLVEPSDPDTTPGSAFHWKYGVGNWFAVSGSSNVDAKAVSLTPSRGASTQAYYARLEPGEIVNLLVELDHPERRALDLSGYAGLTFLARSDVNDHWLTVGFNGVYTGSSAEGLFVGLPSYGEWQRYVLLFDTIFGAAGSLPSALKTIAFAAQASGQPVDLWVDEVALICSGPCP
jgi:hypothetical protein